MTESSFEAYCIVELFGHQRIAGKVTEQVVAGQSFVRVDVPVTKNHPEFTRMFGPGAIYSITPVSEEIAYRAAEAIYIEPITIYLGSAVQLPKPDEHAEPDPTNDPASDQYIPF